MELIDSTALFIGRTVIVGSTAICCLMTGLWMVERILRYLQAYHYVLLAMAKIYRERNANRDQSKDMESANNR